MVGLLTEDELKKITPESALIEWVEQNCANTDTNTVYDCIESIAFHLLGEHLEFDWINNDGGCGTVIIEPYLGKARIEATEYETVRSEYQRLYDLTPEVTEGEATIEEHATAALGWDKVDG